MKPRHLIPAILLVALSLAYPLSLGPVWKWYLKHPGKQVPSALEAFYGPLLRFCKRVPPAGDALDRYLYLWVPEAKQPNS
jgi:hypothetical protein